MAANGEQQRARQEGGWRSVARTLGVLAGRFVCAFALVPLYDVCCQVTGLNGKTSGRAYLGFISEGDQA